jgi:hypothetical protein
MKSPVPHPAAGADPNDAGLVLITLGSRGHRLWGLHACNHDFVAGLELITSNPIFTAPAS